jgi:quercetin dioxygenase-like cupin family protein
VAEPDPVAVSPENYRVLLENEHVRVLAMVLPAGASDREHAHPAQTVYFVRGGKIRIHVPDGAPTDHEFPDGHVFYHGPWTHRLENTGDAEVRAVVVELKR